MKSKPVKGSARTKRFDVGGTVGALAGLGTLAYLMSRKKKGEAGKEFGPQGKFPQEDGGGTSTSKPEPYKAAGNEGKEDIFKGGMKVAKPEASTAVEKKMPRAKGYNPPKDRAPKAKDQAPSTTSNASTTRTDDVIGAGVRSGEAQAKSDAAKKAAGLAEARRKAQAEADAKTAPRRYLQNKAGLSGKGIATPGLRTSKEPTSKAGVVLGGSTVRSDKDKMAERAREVQRRREEAEKSRYKKGGNVKKYADGGMTSSKPEPKKAPMPAFAREAKENRERDQRVKKEQDTYQKGEKTRIKDQGSMFKNGGMTASKRGDGCAMRGKTKGKMY